MPTALPCVYYVCSPVQSGGILMAYRHVDILNKNGISAAILHRKKGERCTWFKNTTVVTSFEEASINQHDILVLPEAWGPQIAAIAPGIKKVIFNQNAYYTCLGYDQNIQKELIPYTHPDFYATLVVSEDNKEYLDYAFPEIRIERIHYAIDPAVFSYSPHKKKKICLMPRKGSNDAQQVLMINHFRKKLTGWEIGIIHDKTHQEVAEIMQESLFYLSFSHNEGFGLAAAEAMACGCVVIGYHGNAGREFYKPEFSYPIVQGEIITFARTLEEQIGRYEIAPQGLLDEGKRASDFIYATYSLEREVTELVQFWSRSISALSQPVLNNI